MADSFQIEGFKELSKELERLPQKVQKKILRKSVRAGAVLMRNRAKILAPKRTGALARAIKVESSTSRSTPSVISYVIGVETGKVQRRTASTGKVATRGKGKLKLRKANAREKRGEDPYYWKFQEFGYRATGRSLHGKGKKGRGRKGLAKARARGIKVPGKHFMRNAFDSTYSSAINLVRNELARGLNNYERGI